MKGKISKAPTLEKNYENILCLPDVTPIDHTKSCPRYTSILSRQEGHGVGIEEMDSLQMEIESLFVNAMQRNRLLKLEAKVLDNEKTESIIINPNVNKILTVKEDTKVEKSSSSTTFNKKLKSHSGKPSHKQNGHHSPDALNLNNKNKNAPIVRNEIPDIFWKSVEPYCDSITEDDIKLLENQLELNDNYLNFPKLGPVGKHYSLQWADEDLNQQIKEGSRFIDLDSSSNGSVPLASPSLVHTPTKRKAIDPNTSLIRKNSLIQESLTKLNKQQNSESSSMSYGPLTQRLISALIEQNLMIPFDNDLNDYLDKLGPNNANANLSSYMSPKTMAKSFHFNPNQNIERKLKKTLIEQGILEMDEIEKQGSHDDENSCQSNSSDLASVHSASNQLEPIDKVDEIAHEILNLQSELKLVTKQCKQTIVHLLDAAKKDMQKQELKKKIHSTDREMVDLFERFKSARLNKKAVSKRDKEKANRLIKERKALKSELSSIS